MTYLRGSSNCVRRDDREGRGFLVCGWHNSDYLLNGYLKDARGVYHSKHYLTFSLMGRLCAASLIYFNFKHFISHIFDVD